ncbi:DUF1501 domain-containing protein [Herpetosiphon llansteffanensis]
MEITRRQFVVGCSTAIAAMAGGRLGGLAFAEPGDIQRDIMVVVFLRGGCDGLGIVSPLDDANFQAARNTITFPGTGTGAGLELGQMGTVPFWLHPKAAAFKELFDSQDLAFIHASGLTNGTRSHFDAMDFMERGTPDNKSTSTGWLTRHMAATSPDGVVPIMSTGSALPASLLGSPNAVTISNVQRYAMQGYGTYGAQQQAALNEIYTKTGSMLDAPATRLLSSIAAVKARNPANPYVPIATYPVGGLSDSLKAIAQMIKLDVGLQVATLDFGGWDTHESQVPILGNQLDVLTRSLHAFYNDLIDYHSKLTIVVMSEFGRRLKANRSAGTDHGHGNLAMVLGGNVNGGRIFGRWPGLANTDLDHGVDLAITTDYRTILSEIVVRRLRNNRLGLVFPQISQYQPLGLVRGTDMAIDWSSGFRSYLPMARR